MRAGGLFSIPRRQTPVRLRWYMIAQKPQFTVLVVDDSPVARKLVENALSPHEYEILPVETGQEALELFEKRRPGLVITDWLMPDLSGIELCERIRSGFANSFTYIILLTSVTEKSEIVRGLQAGADDYLTKPFHAEELAARGAVGRKFARLQAEIEAKNRQLEQLALTDALTDLPNRRGIEQWAKRELSGAMRHSFSFWVVMSDLDNFKSVNDMYGHEAGDSVLKTFAEILQKNSRQCDICGRIGGDEFLMVITHSEREGVEAAIDRIREQIETLNFTFGGRPAKVTASFGIASLQRGVPTNFDRLVAQADEALYSAKRGGRNRIELAAVGVR
jgi:two-component system, cell cycle response regulator